MAFPPSIQQSCAERIFERAQRVTDGRLGQIQPLCSKRETARLNNRYKSKHLTNFWHIAVHGGAWMTSILRKNK